MLRCFLPLPSVGGGRGEGLVSLLWEVHYSPANLLKFA